MRTQVTVYLTPDRKAWLKRYAQKQGFKESELIHWLIERERNVRWLERSLRETDAPAQAIVPKPKTGPDGAKSDLTGPVPVADLLGSLFRMFRQHAASVLVL